MKRNDRKALEDQIRHMDDVPYNPSPEHIEEIKQRANPSRRRSPKAKPQKEKAFCAAL